MSGEGGKFGQLLWKVCISGAFPRKWEIAELRWFPYRLQMEQEWNKNDLEASFRSCID